MAPGTDRSCAAAPAGQLEVGHVKRNKKTLKPEITIGSETDADIDALPGVKRLFPCRV